MIDGIKAAERIAQLTALPFFPQEEHGREAILEIFCDMATSQEQIDWTVKRCLQLWNRWEGPHELRAVFCAKFKPADGVNAYSALPQFADFGIPSESDERNYELLGQHDKRMLSGVMEVDPKDEYDRVSATEFLRSAVLNRKSVDKFERQKALEDIDRIKSQQEANRRGEEAVRETQSAVAKIMGAV